MTHLPTCPCLCTAHLPDRVPSNTRTVCCPPTSLLHAPPLRQDEKPAFPAASQRKGGINLHNVTCCNVPLNSNRPAQDKGRSDIVMLA